MVREEEESGSCRSVNAQPGAVFLPPALACLNTPETYKRGTPE